MKLSIQWVGQKFLVVCKSPILCQICSQLDLCHCMKTKHRNICGVLLAHPEELCVTKCHSCCSVVREHEKRIAHLEQALESLQRGIKKKHLKGSVEEARTKGPLGIDLEELKSTLQLIRNCSEGCNYLLIKLYTIEELTTSSVMGVSTKKGQRKGLNEEKRAIIEGLITEIFPGITITSIHNIMRDRM
ncbi:uncharacterized protein LOC111109508 [Crassostrea virginica]